MVLDRCQRVGFAAGVVGDSSHHRQLHQLALCAEIYSIDYRFSSVARGRYPRPAWLLDFSGRIDLNIALVWHFAGSYRISAGRETDRTNRGTFVSVLAFFFIVVSLLSFVVAQLILKRAMETTTTTGFRNIRFVYEATGGIILMTISFFLTLGLLQRFDLSYLYPFQGLSVIFITLMAAVVLKEKINLRLAIGALLISVGIVLVSLS
jgi:drug/metabolite transporter (DMT)-like permease